MTKDKKTTSIIVVAFSIIFSLGLMATIDRTEKHFHPVLSSWTDNSIKSSIIYFVESVTNAHGNHFVTPQDRIAVFDVDGTILLEKPLALSLSFLRDTIPASLKEKHPYNSLEKNDLKTLYKGNNFNRVYNLLSGITPDEFKEKTRKWLNRYNHPKYEKLYVKMVYKPMIELISYLKDNEFEIYLVTGSDAAFIRAFSSKILGIPENHIIGSHPTLAYKDGKLNRADNLSELNIKNNKVFAIERIIGKKPIVAFGNTDDDLAMMEYVGATERMKLVGLVTHTDKDREYEYTENEKVFDLANKNGWLIVDMKQDFKEIFTDD